MVNMKQTDNFILTGFGKNKLIDMLEWRGDSEKEKDLLLAPEKWPPVYRRIQICEKKEIEACREYLQWVDGLITQYENEHSTK